MTINGVQFNAELVDIIAELKRELELNRIPLLAKTKETKDNIQVCCPYHANGQERRPSAGIHKETGQFHCFACGETHPLQEVISYCFGYTDDILGKQGWSWLLKNFATISVEVRNDIKLDFNRGKNSSYISSNYNSDDALNAANDANNGLSGVHNEFVRERELDKYRYYHPYWTKRGITDKTLIELFDLGYDKETDCITFPVRDTHGNCLFVARRSVKTKYFNYPVASTKPLYGLYELLVTQANPSEIYVTESMLDALSFWQIGKYAVALNGVGSSLQMQQLRALPCRKLILATDADEAGKKARQKIRQEVKNKLITEVVFPTGRKDANECSEDELKDLVEIF